jgi:Zn-dependent M28 family amino/carboxypeptidase
MNACSTEPQAHNTAEATATPNARIVASFDADSALAFAQAQVAFGPRVPNTPAHTRCADYLAGTLNRFGAKTSIQQAQIPDANGKSITIKNIIGAINPDAPNRILLSAHWDTRPIADEDSIRTKEPIEGANDGASGVAVLLEIARQLQAKPLPANIGVDIIFWDAEDGGKESVQDSWCLGSQYWGKNPHIAGYKARYAINLDMVGAKRAIFPQEGHSRKTAPDVLAKIWQTAHQLGHGAYFQFVQYGGVTDDHYYINKLTGIPAVDIIHCDPIEGGFFPHWHTHGDTMDKLDRATLYAVGQTVLTVLYNESPQP